jgi:hypothetical protein
MRANKYAGINERNKDHNGRIDDESAMIPRDLFELGFSEFRFVWNRLVYPQ